MEDNKIYAVVSGQWYEFHGIDGYFKNEQDAMKYCALKNTEVEYEDDEYYIVNLEEIKEDVSKVELKYYYKIVFNFNTGIKKECKYYYTGKDKEEKISFNVYKDVNGWIAFEFTCDSQEKAEKIAQDKYAEFLAYYNEFNSYEKAGILIGGNIQGGYD